MKKKKIAAAIAAVFDYIKTQEEASACYIPEIHIQNPLEQGMQMVAQPAQKINLWGISGREAHMQTRSMMQLRLFK